jgi:hypothetical protein
MAFEIVPRNPAREQQLGDEIIAQITSLAIASICCGIGIGKIHVPAAPAPLPSAEGAGGADGKGEAGGHYLRLSDPCPAVKGRTREIRELIGRIDNFS